MGTVSSLPPITNRQKDLLRLIYKFRFLDRVQIQMLMGHKDKRLINVWLKDLCQKNYLSQKYSNKFPDNIKPAIYLSNLKAIRYFKQLGEPDTVISRLYRDYTRTSYFISGQQLLADITIELRKASNETINYDFATSSDHANPETLGYRLGRYLVSPDALFTKYDKSGNTTTPYIIEITPRNYRSYLLKARIKSYFDFYRYNDWEERTGLGFPEIIFISFSHAHHLAAKRFYKRCLDEDYRLDFYGLSIRFILASQIKESGLIGQLKSANPD